MGPLVPQNIIGAEWNYLIALLIGVAFGAILESAGFSSSRKLAGVFYGYDFVVLRVFFTAAITAMLGLIYFHHFGWIDLDMVFVNPLYLKSAIIGGVVMGAGFIMGGFCPGTSVCAVAIGKIDAIAYVGGILIGILIFGETFSLWEELYNGSFLGALKVYDSLGISEGLFAFALIVVALAAFIVTARIEKKVKKVDY